MVKIIARDGKEVIFDNKDVENDLKKVGLPERVAQEVAERVEKRVEEGWTYDQVRQETDVELRRLQEDIDLAHSAFKGTTSMGPYNIGETRSTRENDSTAHPRSETRVECRNVE